MFSGRSLCTRSLASLSSLLQIQFHHRKIICCCCRCAKIKQNTATIDDNFFQNTPAMTAFKTREVLQSQQQQTTRAGFVKWGPSTVLQSGDCQAEFEIGSSGTFMPNLPNSKAMQATECKASARKTSRALSNITAFQSTLSGRLSPRSRGATNVLVKRKISFFFSAIVSRQPVHLIAIIYLKLNLKFIFYGL